MKKVILVLTILTSTISQAQLLGAKDDRISEIVITTVNNFKLDNGIGSIGIIESSAKGLIYGGEIGLSEKRVEITGLVGYRLSNTFSLIGGLGTLTGVSKFGNTFNDDNNKMYAKIQLRVAVTKSLSIHLFKDNQYKKIGYGLGVAINLGSGSN